MVIRIGYIKDKYKEYAISFHYCMNIVVDEKGGDEKWYPVC